MVEELDLLEVSALQWRACVESACDYGATMSANRYAEFKLEEFTLESIANLGDRRKREERVLDGGFDRLLHTGGAVEIGEAP